MKIKLTLHCFVYLLDQVVKEHYKNADIGSIIGLSFYSSTMIRPIGVEYSDTTDGWSIHVDSKKQYRKVCRNINSHFHHHSM